MLSVIICSRNPVELAAVCQNVQKHVGVPYEIIAIDNNSNRYGICEAYNIGAAKANYNYLCFMHEDIRVHSMNWGITVIDILKDPKVGVIGVAGGVYQPNAPCGWHCGLYNGINVVHTVKGTSEHSYSNPWNQVLMRVATLDGLWLCCRKNVWEEFKFDPKDFPGFHFYDVDFCARVAQKYNNYLTFNVEVEHFSYGTFDNVWFQKAIDFHKKRKNILPVKTFAMSKTQQNAYDLIELQAFTLRVIRANMPAHDIIYCLKECLKLGIFNRDNLYLVKKFIKGDRT